MRTAIPAGRPGHGAARRPARSHSHALVHPRSAVLRADRIILFADDEAAGQLTAIDCGELTSAPIALVSGGTAAWIRAGLPVVASPADPPDAERIDYVFWNHDRHAGNEDAMRAYLQWEIELPAQVAAEGLSGFRLAAT